MHQERLPEVGLQAHLIGRLKRLVKADDGVALDEDEAGLVALGQEPRQRVPVGVPFASQRAAGGQVRQFRVVDGPFRRGRGLVPSTFDSLAVQRLQQVTHVLLAVPRLFLCGASGHFGEQAFVLLHVVSSSAGDYTRTRAWPQRQLWWSAFFGPLPAPAVDGRARAWWRCGAAGRCRRHAAGGCRRRLPEGACCEEKAGDVACPWRLQVDLPYPRGYAARLSSRSSWRNPPAAQGPLP